MTSTTVASDDRSGANRDGNGVTDADAELDELDKRRPLRPLLWRLHFLSGFLAAPIVLWLAVTGILYAWNPQIEGWLHSDALSASGAGTEQPLSTQVEATQAAYPGHTVEEITPAAGEGDTTGVLLAPPGAVAEGFGPIPGAFTAYVDPGTAEVTGTIQEDSRPNEWLKSLHSSFRFGTGSYANTLIELAASMVLVALLTGFILWWPKSKRALRRAFVPRLTGLRDGGRRPWRDLHSSVGAIALVLLFTIVVTGLTWTENAGDWVDRAKDSISSESPQLSTELTGASGEGGDAAGGGGHGAHGGAGGEATPIDLQDLDTVATAAVASDLNAPYTITPGEPGSAWKVAEIDNRWPLRQATIAVDPTTGQVTDRIEFSDQAAMDQLTTIGIGFHEAKLFGLVNQLLLTAMALAVIVVVLTGYMAWWRRRPEGAFGAPPKPGMLLRTAPWPLLVGFVVLMVLLPVFGVATVVYLVVERLVRLARRRPVPAS